MLNILKNVTSLTKKKPFFTFVVVCLLILMCLNSNCFQIIEGKRLRFKKKLQNPIEINKRDIKINKNTIKSNKNAIKSNENAIEKNKQKIITLFSKLYNTDNNDSIGKTVGKQNIGLQIDKK